MFPQSLEWKGVVNALPFLIGAAIFFPATSHGAQVSRVVQICLDGLGAKYLQFFVTNAPAQFPNFARLSAEGAFTYNARCDYDFSETVPNHASMFTARPVWQPAGMANTIHHGFDSNFPMATNTFHNFANTNVPYKSSMFDVAHDYGLSTALYTGKTRLAVCDRSYDAANGGPDLIDADNGRDKIDFASIADVSGVNIANEVTTLLQNLNSAAPTNYSFVHITEPDMTGHASGWRSANWSNAVRNVDAQLGRILNAIDTNLALSNQTALIVTADHGGGGVTQTTHTESYHVTNYTVPFFLRAPGIPAGSDLYNLFANRADPGTNRMDYQTQPQPIRNSDGSNLALNLLGLPPIPGSFFVPAFVESTVSLSIARFEDRVSVFWSDTFGAYELQAADALVVNTRWDTITTGIVVSGATRVYTVTDPNEFASRFFRLKKKQ